MVKLLTRLLKSLDNFKDGFIFRDSGKLVAKYNDYDKPKIIELDGHKVKVYSNIYITKSTYELGLSEDYRSLLRYLSTHDISKDLYYDYDDDIIK